MVVNLIKIACPNCAKSNRLPQDKLGLGPKCGNCHQPLFTGQPIDLSNSTFSKIVGNTEIPVVVDFWAEWCGPCKMMAPIFQHVARELEPNVRFAKLNTEIAQNIAAQYAIRSIPTLIIFKNGKEAARQSGALDAGSLKQFIQVNN